ncbi:MAG: histone deacetylase [Candidatus Thorarchaeota archaeon]
MSEIKIAIITDEDFATKNNPPFPKPSFISFESPVRIRFILNHLEKKKFFEDDHIIKESPKNIDDSIIKLAHSQYHIDSIKRISSMGGGILSDEVYITSDTYFLAKKAVGGCIKAIETVLNGLVSQSFALIRPPGHHALKERASGLCIFNNIANAILYLRKELGYNKKIAIIDIDNHYGDGLAQYFYEDPSVLYCSIHEFDFSEGDFGLFDELGQGDGLGRNINFPVPAGAHNDVFYEFLDLINPILYEFQPDLIIVAAGFDMYFADPVGNCKFTSIAYYNFTEKVLKVANSVCQGKVVFILEGGYSIIGIPYCVEAILRALLLESYKPPEFEEINFTDNSVKEEVMKVKIILKKLLKPYWNQLK